CAHQRVDAGHADAGLGDAYAHGDAELDLVGDDLRAHHALADTLGDRSRARQAGFGQQNSELLAAEAANDIRLALAIETRSRDRPDRGVADGMAGAVVDRLEVIDVEHQHRDGAIIALEAAPFSIEAFQKMAAVE